MGADLVPFLSCFGGVVLISCLFHFHFLQPHPVPISAPLWVSEFCSCSAWTQTPFSFSLTRNVLGDLVL